MSLFKARDVWSTQCGVDEEFDQCCIAVAKIGSHFEKIIVGSHSGFLRIFQPSPEKLEMGLLSGYSAADLLIEMQLQYPIIQIGTGKLVSGSQNLHISVLHPRGFAVYSLVTKPGATEHGDQNRLLLAYEHNLRRSAYSMVVGPFGGVQGRDFLCIQSLDGTLSFFEQETFAFNRFLPGFLLPGPLVFLPHTDSFLTVTSTYHAQSYRYQVLAEAEGSMNQDATSGKKVVADWEYNMGECALDIVCVTWSISNCEILILGEKNLYCLKDTGSLQFMKRLEYTACCFHPYFVEPDGRLMVLVATDTGTMLVYEQTTLRWSAQLPFTPVAVRRGNFQNIDGLMVLLSSSGQMQCCYLGTEPSLFVAPPLDINPIDYEEAEMELKELQKAIKAQSKVNNAALTTGAMERELAVTVTTSPRLGGESSEEQPACRVIVELNPHAPLSKVQVSVVVIPPLGVSQGAFTISSLCERNHVVAFVYLEKSGCDVPSLEVRVVTSYMTSAGGFPRVIQSTAQLPLRLVAAVCTPTKEADYKITLNSSQPVVPLPELFPEFADSGTALATANAIGFQWLSQNNCAVTVMAAKSSQRYRLQADTLPPLCLFVTQLVERLHKYFAKKKDFTCVYASTIPLPDLFTEVENHFRCRATARKLQEELTVKTAQFRAIQRRLLTKFKDKTPTPVTKLDLLLKETYAQIVVSARQYEENQHALQRASCELSCVVRLILQLVKLISSGSQQQGLEDLVAAMPVWVHDTEQQGWEEVTEAAMCHLLRTTLAKSSKDQHRATPITLETIKDVGRLKKHITAVVDRVTRSGNRLLERRESDGEFVEQPLRTVSPISESGEVVGEEAVVPPGSRLGERKVSAVPRGRSAALLEARRLKANPEGLGIKPVSNDGVASTNQQRLVSAFPAGVIESPAEIFPSGEDNDIW